MGFYFVKRYAMTILEMVLIALGLSMDAFAVATCRGLEMPKFNWKHALVIALFFGVFQALMPLIGWAVGSTFSKYIENVDHWIAFALLAVIGLNMIWDSFKKEKQEDKECNNQGLKIIPLIFMAIATSVDALVVGITIAFINANIWITIAIIGSITFVLSFIGVAIGHKVGSKFKRVATAIGGVVLILIGLKILLEHLGVISF